MATRDLQVFTNDAFGMIRTVEHEDKVYFCGRDVATALGYKDPTNAIKQHCKGWRFTTPSRMRSSLACMFPLILQFV